jgi:hypothetical protein
MISVSRLSGPPEKGVKKIAHAIYHIVSRKSVAKLQPHFILTKYFCDFLSKITFVKNFMAVIGFRLIIILGGACAP